MALTQHSLGIPRPGPEEGDGLPGHAGQLASAIWSQSHVDNISERPGLTAPGERGQKGSCLWQAQGRELRTHRDRNRKCLDWKVLGTPCFHQMYTMAGAFS